MEARRINPSKRDYCKGGWSGRADEQDAKADPSKCFKVLFTRQYAACLFILSHPCGFELWVKLVPESESPTKVLTAAEECFRDDKPSVMQFDSTCRVMPSMYATDGKNKHLGKDWADTLWIVNPIRFESHLKTDILCQENYIPSNHSFLWGPDGSFRFNGTVWEQSFNKMHNLEPTPGKMRPSRSGLH